MEEKIRLAEEKEFLNRKHEAVMKVVDLYKGFFTSRLCKFPDPDSVLKKLLEMQERDIDEYCEKWSRRDGSCDISDVGTWADLLLAHVGAVQLTLEVGIVEVIKRSKNSESTGGKTKNQTSWRGWERLCYPGEGQ